MKSHVLSVGQCNADDSQLARVLAIEADAHMERAGTIEDALQKISSKAYDLVLVNRIIDADGQSGIELITAAKQTGYASPMMLVSDFQEAQAKAVAEGAVPGFGKRALGTPELGQMLRETIHSGARAGRA